MEGEREGPPNPLLKAAATSNLPRQARARIDATTDPVPEGKKVEASPGHHFRVEPASHDKDRAEAKTPAELGLSEREANMKEIAKMQNTGGGSTASIRKDIQAGMDYQGASTAANKRMDPRHRGNDFRATGRASNKHTDSVYHSK